MFDKIRFTVTEDHLKLLRRMEIGWEDCEYGAPAVDCKRPYGNSSVEYDICEILGWQFDADDGPSDFQREQAEKIHRETEQALQIVLSVGRFQSGVFEVEQYHRNWKRVE